MRAVLCLVAACLAAYAADAITLPPETAALAHSPLPGYMVAMQKCGICHSADYITLQPPHMTFEQWGKEMAKMQHTYGAPISDAEITLLAAYLASTYGDAVTVPKEARVSPASLAQSDVQTLINSNGCLGCHALQQKIVGPAFRDVAAKYRGNPEALVTVESHIRSGGQGRWGAVPMPPFSGLDARELEMLATFVLQQH
jgi:cytochrome c551/c552